MRRRPRSTKPLWRRRGKSALRGGRKRGRRIEGGDGVKRKRRRSREGEMRLRCRSARRERRVKQRRKSVRERNMRGREPRWRRLRERSWPRSERLKRGWRGSAMSAETKVVEEGEVAGGMTEMIEMREEEVVEEVGGMTGLHLEAILPLDVEVRRRDHVCSWQQGLLVLVVEEVDGGRGKGRKKNHGVQVAGMEIVPPGATHLQEGALLREGVHPQGGAHLHGEAALLGGMKEEVMEEVGDVEVVEVDLLQGEVLHPGGALLQDVDHLLGEVNIFQLLYPILSPRSKS